MTTGKTIALTRQAFDGKMMSLLFNTLSRFVIAFLPRNKCLLTSWMQCLSAMILEPKEIKFATVTFFPLNYLQWSGGTRCHDLSFLNVEFYISFFHSPLSLSSRGSLVSLHFLPLGWYYLHIWDCWCFSQQSWFQLEIHPAWHFKSCTPHIN